MTEESEDPLFERILVALDASDHSMAALEAAARLASSIEADLQGLFVEDINWFKLCKHSSTKEISEITGNVRQIDEERIEQQVKALSRRMERAIQQVGELARINYSFRSVRGGVEKKLLHASEQADLITLGRVGQSFTRGVKLGRTARAILEKSKKPVLLLQHGLKLGNSIVAVYDGSEKGKKALELAKNLARQVETQLQIIVFSDELEDPDDHVDEIKRNLGNHHVATSIFKEEAPEPFHLARMITAKKGGLLIVNRDQPLFQNTALERLLSNIKCPILLI